ncbi:hypothetical protein G7046_g1390 [Stylonectria norvegica]|nr:hypothetical protein G7046_g1390 [Stylonectria norvegica]
MASKRDLDDVDDGEIPEPEPKRPKKQKSKARDHQNSGIDPTWGQKYVFSGMAKATTIPAGEESDFEDDADAMAYLNSVRQEANGIPHLLVAPKVEIGPQLPADFQTNEDSVDEGHQERADRTIYRNGIGDARGYYQDGAYTAMPETNGDSHNYEEGDGRNNDLDKETALQEAYFKTLIDQYLRLRTTLNSTPPPNAASRLSASQPTFAAPFNRHSSTISLWSRVLSTTDPHPLQLALMSKDSIICILCVLLGGKLLRRGYSLPERTSRWLWALLARLPDKGELNHTEIGWVRDLGRRAVLLGRSMAEMAALREELQDGGLGAHEAVDESSSDEEVFAEIDYAEVHGANSPDDKEDDPAPAPDHKDEQKPPKLELEEGEAEEEDDVAMDIASDSDAEDGEVVESPVEDLRDAKARLLARIEDEARDVEAQERAEEAAAKERSGLNMRATVNMILTVAGEFYGQRDLLEFREPFASI